MGKADCTRGGRLTLMGKADWTRGGRLTLMDKADWARGGRLTFMGRVPMFPPLPQLMGPGVGTYEAAG